MEFYVIIFDVKYENFRFAVRQEFTTFFPGMCFSPPQPTAGFSEAVCSATFHFKIILALKIIFSLENSLSSVFRVDFSISADKR